VTFCTAKWCIFILPKTHPNEFWEEPAEEGKEWQGQVTAIRLVRNTGYVE